jgi:predicted small secreted protein
MVRIDPSEMKKIINDEFSNIANTDGSHIIFVEWQDGNDEYDSHSFVPLNDGNSFIYNDGDQPTRQTKSIKEALGKKGNKEGSKISYMKKNQPNRINSAVSPINQKNGVRVLEGEEKDKFEKSLEKQ